MMKKMRPTLLVDSTLTAVALCAGLAHAQNAASLEGTLSQLNASSAKFSSASASFHKDLYTAAIRDHDLQDGITYTVRKGGSAEVGFKITGNGARTVTYKNGTAIDYNAGLNCTNSYSAAKSKGTIESLLALSFGASGNELKSNWEISGGGTETMNSDGHDVKVVKLDLVPKDAGLRNNITRVTLWIDPVRDVALKQVVYAPTGDTQTATYSNIRMGEKVDTAPFRVNAKPCSK